MKILTTTLTSLILLASPSPFASEVYRIVDAEGQVTFTDSPAANTKAETVDLPKTNIATAPPPRTIEGEGEAAGEEVPYTSARITQPLNNATIPPGQKMVVVTLALEPALQEGHLAQLYIDGRAQGPATASTTFSVSNLNRGEHKVYIEVLGGDKKRKAKVDTVTFHVKQHSANN
jgi:hypothetical protein